MKILIDIDNDQLNDIIVASLVEYHQYLSKADWSTGNGERLELVHAFNLVLSQYMSPTEYDLYVAKQMN
jgi:hypothetical protein